LIGWYAFLLRACLRAALLFIFMKRWISGWFKLNKAMIEVISFFWYGSVAVDIELAHQILLDILFEVSEIDKIDRNNVNLKNSVSR
jgi:hypothetical protein